MTSEAETAINYWTHGAGSSLRPHDWRYLGRIKQSYHCIMCGLRVTKTALKDATDA